MVKTIIFAFKTVLVNFLLSEFLKIKFYHFFAMSFSEKSRLFHKYHYLPIIFDLHDPISH
jgi:hypothetical protein